jgi:hypothetical protein
MTTLAILLMATAVPSADVVPSADPMAQPPPASSQRFSHMRRLFGRQSHGQQQQPGSAWVGPPGGDVQPAPIEAGPITPPVLSQGTQQRPGCACGVRPVPAAVTGGAADPITPPVMSQGPQQQPGGGAGRLVPVPVSRTHSATEPSPAMSRPEVTTPPVSPEMRRMPVGPAEGNRSPF